MSQTKESHHEKQRQGWFPRDFVKVSLKKQLKSFSTNASHALNSMRGIIIIQFLLFDSNTISEIIVLQSIDFVCVLHFSFLSFSFYFYKKSQKKDYRTISTAQQRCKRPTGNHAANNSGNSKNNDRS